MIKPLEDALHHIRILAMKADRLKTKVDKIVQSEGIIVDSEFHEDFTTHTQANGIASFSDNDLSSNQYASRKLISAYFLGSTTSAKRFPDNALASFHN